MSASTVIAWSAFATGRSVSGYSLENWYQSMPASLADVSMLVLSVTSSNT